MTYEFIESYFLLLRVDITLRILGFKNIYDAVRQKRPQKIAEPLRTPHDRLCHAMDHI
jgi:hypothetical protein